MLLIADDGSIVHANHRAEELLGYAHGDLVGRSFETLVADCFRSTVGEDPPATLSAQIRSMEPHIELNGLRRDGSKFQVEVTLTPLPAATRRPLFTGVMRSTADRAPAQATSLRPAEGTRELEDFAIAISHDLRTPLRKIRTFGERLRSGREGELTKSGRDYLERMDGTAQRMQTLLDSLLVLSRTATSAQRFQSTDLAKIAQAALLTSDLDLDEAGGHVDVGELPTIEADPFQIEQLLTNLISNALKFHHEGRPPEIRISGSIVEMPRGPGRSGLCEISVEDQGIGFDEQYRDRIFRPFERLVDREQFEGTGIGLAMCRKIVDFHHGSIMATSTPGKGSTFIVTLPVRQGAQTAD